MTLLCIDDFNLWGHLWFFDDPEKKLYIWIQISLALPNVWFNGKAHGRMKRWIPKCWKVSIREVGFKGYIISYTIYQQLPFYGKTLCAFCAKLCNFFLAVQNSSIGDLVTHWLTDSLTRWLRVLYWLTYKERPKRLVTFETFDWSDEETCTDQKKDNDRDKDKDKDNDRDNDKDKYI